MPVIDATTLLYFLEPNFKAPRDPGTNKPISDARVRIDLLIGTLEARDETILIPTPAMSEVLVHAVTAGPKYLKILLGANCFRIASFDERAAVELASMTRDALGEGDLRAGTSTTCAKLKFDRQIITIARVHNQTTVYSDDNDIARLADALDLEVIPTQKLPQPVESRQMVLDLVEED